MIGKSLVFRDASNADAKFIRELRTDRRKGKFLTATSSELQQQVEWLKNYSKQSDQVYFIIENKEGERLGTVRLYDPKGGSFCWGSWILKDGAPKSAAIESALMVYAYAIDHLGFSQSHFDVRKGNERVWKFHERFGAVRIGETKDDFLYQIDLEEIQKSRCRYKRFLPHPLSIEKYHVNS